MSAMALEAILRVRGELTPEIVVEEATPEDHPLHKYFTWDDAEAARAHRLDQAADLIRSVKVTRVENGGTPQERKVRVRAYISEREISGEGGSAGRYLPVADVVADDMLRASALRAMEHEWQSLRRKYIAFEEFTEMVRRDLEKDVA